MNQDHQWTLPIKRKGISLKKATPKFDPDYLTALANMAESETLRIGSTISQGTILTDLTTKDSEFHRIKRTELGRRYRQLKRGKHDAITTTEEAS